MAKVHSAARLAQVHDDIMRTPMQYPGLVGDMGSTLSGGQRQRVLLARALYRNPRIIFLDEGTANLDEATEEAIADLIESLPITRIVVAHRSARFGARTAFCSSRIANSERSSRRGKLGRISEQRDMPMAAHNSPTCDPPSSVRSMEKLSSSISQPPSLLTRAKRGARVVALILCMDLAAFA
jgi:ABC-type phosphate transport system ATPase subunit